MIENLFDLVLQSRINPQVLTLVNALLDDEQLALLLVKQINPYFELTQQQEAKLRGVSPKTLRGRKQRGEIPGNVNDTYSRSFPKKG